MTMFFQMQIAIVTASAMLLTVIGLLATLRRGQWPVTLLFSAFSRWPPSRPGKPSRSCAPFARSRPGPGGLHGGVSALTSWLRPRSASCWRGPNRLRLARRRGLPDRGADPVRGAAKRARSAYVVPSDGAGSDALIQLGGMARSI
jgi:hypothetical protein